ncbi:hypothetical protein [Klenkia taihuensis]|uniref:Uncharacterized protein n=1 Tax=Klenkia taihuensis TaxID=1225127 RepID=A0A1I1U780_9ACTN|nr:hypothetical protein [Klenkia taihuensis]GHE06871.1 hypothetical protein GCM10011381_00480 [Klenkia taihuensis]SFD66716.1 hypothetical protein SAMN05661030_3949 [Klenkia taihuensis]
MSRTSNLTDRASHAVQVGIYAVIAWLRADDVTDDRGSDSSEKAFMVILAIALGGAVTAGAVAFVTGKIALFQ